MQKKEITISNLNKLFLEDQIPAKWKKPFSILFAILGSLDGILIFARFVEENLFLITGLIVIAVLVIGMSWLMYVRQSRFLLMFLGISLIAIIPLWFWLGSTTVKLIKIEITDPKNDGTVGMQYLVKGGVSDPEADVSVLVHPIQNNQSWVQKPPIVGPDGTWQTSCNFGTETLGIGEQYEIIAVATKENFLVNLASGNYLHIGQTLEKLPQKTNKSHVVTVTRQE